MSYESPIEMFTDTVGNYWSEQNDELVMKEVVRVGVTVDKEELVKALAYDRDQYEKGFHDGIMANKWIPTSERLPEEQKDVLLTYQFQRLNPDLNSTLEYIITQNVCIAYYIDKTGISKSGVRVYRLGWYTQQEGDYIPCRNAVAWMPLPEPYKEEENG